LIYRDFIIKLFKRLNYLRARTTIMDIANRLGITPSAVSRVVSSQPKVSLVLFDRTHDVDKVGDVTMHDFGGAVKATERLAVRGYTRTAHLAGYAYVLPFGKRLAGYKLGLATYVSPIESNIFFNVQ